jgi:ribosomal protein S27E|tara:strand:- start:195 stop:410 length:216 start_codon:yes stop_codon:yes gene_type:complete
MFGDINLKAEIVNGTCPTCTENTLLVSLTPDFFRCITCGTDLKQHINGKISYIPQSANPKDIKLEVSTTNG